MSSSNGHQSTTVVVVESSRSPQHEPCPQAEKMKAQLASLPPLSVPNMGGVTKDGSLSDGVSGTLYRKTDLLLSDLLKMSAGIKVVDITGKTSGACVSLDLYLCI